MEPREVAVLIRRHHTDLRAMLDRLDALIDRLVAEDAGATTLFFAHCHGLISALLTHIDLEDAVIVPLLRAHHAQGETQAMDLLHHHEAQRRWLQDVLIQRDAPPTGETLRAIRALAHVLRADMDHEEDQLSQLVRAA